MLNRVTPEQIEAVYLVADFLTSTMQSSGFANRRLGDELWKLAKHMRDELDMLHSTRADEARLIHREIATVIDSLRCVADAMGSSR